MQTFLLRATHQPPSPFPPGSQQAIFACVARGSGPAAEAVVRGELHRAGWRVLELIEPAALRLRMPGLKRHPEVARTLAAAQTRGMAFLVLDLDPSTGMTD